MKKNVAGQVVCAQLISKTDGSDVTSGTTTVYVTGDGGTQASGSGSVAHEGNGLWSYAPTQAETNYNHVAFTFVNSSAVSVTVQVYTSHPQTGDAYGIVSDGTYGNAAIKSYVDDLESRLTATRAGYLDNLAGGAVALNSDIQTLLSRIVGTLAAGTHNPQSGDSYATVNNGAYGNAAIKNYVDDLESRLTATRAGYLDNLAGGAVALNSDIQTLLSRIVGTLAAGTHQPQTGDSYAKVNDAGYGLAALKSLLDAISSYVDTEVAAIKAKTDNLPSSPAATGDIPTLVQIADAVHDEVVEGTLTLRQIVRVMLSALALKTSGGGTTTLRARNLGDTKDRIILTVDEVGNRSAVTLDGE